MKLSLKIAQIFVRLKTGEIISASSAKNKIVEELITENILARNGKHRKTIQLINARALEDFLANKYQIQNLDEYVLLLENKSIDKAEMTKIGGDSKIRTARSFKGFLINTYNPINAELHGDLMPITPKSGSFTFIYDFESFQIPKNLTIVGVENPTNFRFIEKQKQLFKAINPLFISRYPQNQSKDLMTWLKSIPNNYLHFGDFDLAGIGIYLNEYKKHLGNRATFYIPPNIKDIMRYGNPKRYDIQKMNYKLEAIEEEEVLELLKLIHDNRKGLDQEYLIGE
ncbi:MAG: hypothetical protein GQ574_01625 [Crocinitomix sp.]|nr:hypothetical protein [Crocinitomix sp.]